MKGTEKQIKWAEDIINKVNTMIDNLVKDYWRLEAEADGLGEATCKYTDKELAAIKKMFAERVETMTAGQIINSRDAFTLDGIEMTAKRMHRSK